MALKSLEEPLTQKQPLKGRRIFEALRKTLSRFNYLDSLPITKHKNTYIVLCRNSSGGSSTGTTATISSHKNDTDDDNDIGKFCPFMLEGRFHCPALNCVEKFVSKDEILPHLQASHGESLVISKQPGLYKSSIGKGPVLYLDSKYSCSNLAPIFSRDKKKTLTFS